LLYDLQEKEINPAIYAEKIFDNPNLIPQYLDGLSSKNETYRYNCFKVLNIVSEKKPALLYSHWDFFENHLRSKNNYHKIAAVIIIANLTFVDNEERFENLFDDFYINLQSEKTITPIYVIKSSWKIVNSKPHLEKKITDILLDIEKIHAGKQIELVKSAVIESFSNFFNNSKNKDKIINFVKKQLDSESPKTRKTAKDFLKKYVEK
jgi:hypothetical protein